jgi:hypothetical protein
LLVGPFSAKFGRRHGLWAATVLNFVATSIQLGTTSKAALYVARLILGEHYHYHYHPIPRAQSLLYYQLTSIRRWHWHWHWLG